MTQHLARLSEAISTLLLPHDLRDHPEAAPLLRAGASVEIRNVAFRYPGGRSVFENLNLRLMPGERVGLVGQSGGGKSTLFAPAAAVLRRPARRHLHRRTGHPARHAGKPARRDRGRAAGRLAVPPLGDREHPLRPAGRLRRRGAARRTGRALPRLHRGDAAGHGHDRRRPRRETVGRAAPAHRDRARADQGRSAPAARRGDLRARQRVRGSRARGARPI